MESSEHTWANISETICPELLIFNSFCGNVAKQLTRFLLPVFRYFECPSFAYRRELEVRLSQKDKDGA